MYGLTEGGLCGIPLISEDSDIARIDNTIQLLNLRDLTVRDNAWDELGKITSYRYNGSLIDNINDFLNSATSEKSSNRYSSQWIRARTASERLRVKWIVDDEFKVKLVCDNVVITERRAVFSCLRTCFLKRRLGTLADAHPHQGKTFNCIILSKSSSHFITDGCFTTFKEWRFIHRDRLSLVPLKGYKHGPGTVNKCFIVCGFPSETLPHVLNSCMPQSNKLRKPHNDIGERIKRAATGRWEVIGENQKLGTEDLRPDLVLKKDNDILILDITVPFENDHDAFKNARLIKEQKPGQRTWKERCES